MGHAEGWIILRCAGRATLRLASALTGDGIEAWTPAEAKRFPGKRARRDVPVMPTFVFARAARLDDLLELAESPAAKIGFSVFRHYEKIPVVADAELDALRRFEARSAPPEQWPRYAPDAEVQAAQGPYTGLSGKVIRQKGEWALVMFGWHRVKISAFILQPTSVTSRSSAQQGNAARAA